MARTPRVESMTPNQPPSPPAVFARNHRNYLEEACEVARADSERVVTFRSAQAWASAKKLLEARGAGDLPVYFAVVGEGPEVRYKARLREVLLRPASNQPDSKRLLNFVPKKTRDEGIWKEASGSLYAVSGCYELPRPFPISDLHLQTGAALSIDFKYSYALVHERDTEEEPFYDQAVDLPAPPARAEARLQRIIRDTVLTRKMKRLYDDQCQRCGTRLALDRGRAYSEGHHLKPLGRPHNGPDIAANLLVVCPNCHALLDLLASEIATSDLTLKANHRVSAEYVDYHNNLVREKRAT